MGYITPNIFKVRFYHLKVENRSIMNYYEQLNKLKKQMKKENSVTLELPNRFSFKEHNIYEFDELFSFFDWSLKDRQVKIDLTKCKAPNYQALSLLILYAWRLGNNGCTVSFIESDEEKGASQMWRTIGARGAFPVLLSDNMNFNGNDYKPLFAIRNTDEFKKCIETVETYVKDFDVEYLSTLRYVLSEIFYNTIEHGYAKGGKNIKFKQIPSIAQFTWYKKSNEIHFIIADCGMGIKKHIQKSFPGQESHEAAIKLAIKPQTSGNFNDFDPYKQKNNAGMGMFLSTNIIRRLKADMHIISGNGLVHISPRDITGKTLKSFWNGTIVLVTINIEKEPGFILQKIMQEFREEAIAEQKKAEKEEKDDEFYVNIYNYFGIYADSKDEAIKFRDNKLFPEINNGKKIVLDFENITSAPHSFLSALLASPIKTLGMFAYKRFKFINTSPVIRETIDFILDDNT